MTSTAQDAIGTLRREAEESFLPLGIFSRCSDSWLFAASVELGRWGPLLHRDAAHPNHCASFAAAFSLTWGVMKCPTAAMAAANTPKSSEYPTTGITSGTASTGQMK